ncbi:hypothetical protein N665_0152s0003 [Sinapis alba]|nr:hypothetical protein N665_0152s0003 [Sinapis alba]
MCLSLASGFHEETKDLLSRTLRLLCSPSTISCSYTPRIPRISPVRLLSLFVVSLVSHRCLCSHDVIHFLPEAYSPKLPSALRERFLHFHFRVVYVERGKWWK